MGKNRLRKWLFIYALCETGDINVDSDAMSGHNERCSISYSMLSVHSGGGVEAGELYEEEWRTGSWTSLIRRQDGGRDLNV